MPKFMMWDKEYNLIIESDEPTEYLTLDGNVVEMKETFSYSGTDASMENISESRVIFESTGINDSNGKEIFFDFHIVDIEIEIAGGSVRRCGGVIGRDIYANPVIKEVDFYFADIRSASSFSIEIVGNLYEPMYDKIRESYGLSVGI